ncbi:MAG: hypothetical protein SFU99_20500, partial [Saprospiraceae bacterium]|nr:hypothetical protein [Saprospiraceae bacterium]
MQTYFEAIPWILLNDFLRYFIAASIGFLLFWVLFKKQLRHRFLPARLPKTSQFWFEFGYSMSTVVIFATVGWIMYVLKNLGYTRIYDIIAERGWLYFALSIPLLMIVHDFYFYWTH